jgi:hypothetical protein
VGSDWVHLVLQALFGLLYQPQVIDDDWLWSNWQGKQKYREKTCPNDTISTTNPTWLHPGCCDAEPTTNWLNCGWPYTSLNDTHYEVSINILGTSGLNYFPFSDTNVLFLRSELSWQINAFKSSQEISHVNVKISTNMVDLVNDHMLLVISLSGARRVKTWMQKLVNFHCWDSLLGNV